MEVAVWESHVLANVPFYTVLLPLFLDLLRRRGVFKRRRRSYRPRQGWCSSFNGTGQAPVLSYLLT